MKIFGIILVIFGGFWVFGRLLNQPTMLQIIKGKIDDEGLFFGIRRYLSAELFGFGFGMGIMGIGFYLINPEFLNIYILTLGIFSSLVFLWWSFKLSRLLHAQIILFGIWGLIFWGIGGLLMGIVIGWIIATLIGFTSILRGKILNKHEFIDEKKVRANLLIMKHGSFEMAKSLFDDENNALLKFATNSIKKLDFFNIPLGFPTLFVATYPDVVLWWQGLSEEDQGDLLDLEGFYEKDVLNFEDKIKTKYLEVVVNKYRECGVVLECIERSESKIYEFINNPEDEQTVTVGYDDAEKCDIHWGNVVASRVNKNSIVCSNGTEYLDTSFDEKETEVVNKQCPFCGGHVDRFLYVDNFKNGKNGDWGDIGWMEVCFRCKKPIYLKFESEG